MQVLFPPTVAEVKRDKNMTNLKDRGKFSSSQPEKGSLIVGKCDISTKAQSFSSQCQHFNLSTQSNHPFI